MPIQPCHPGCSFSQLLNGHLARKEEKMLANHMFWQLMISYTHLLLLLKTPVMWLSIVVFNNAGKPKWILRKFDVSRIQARLDGLPHLETLHGKIWTLLRGTGHPTYHVNMIKLIERLYGQAGYPT